MLILINVIALLASFYLLAVIVDRFFVDSLERIAKRFNMSFEVAGATLMAMGSSAPELFTSLIATLRGNGHSDIGAGTIVGSAIFNILVIVGASAMFRKAKLTWQPVLRDLLFYSATIALLLIVFWDGVVTLSEALLFVAFYGVYIFAVKNWGKWLKYTPADDADESNQPSSNLSFAQKAIDYVFSILTPNSSKQYFRVFIVSVIAIGALSFVLVESAVSLATTLKVSSAIIGLTVLAAGTSIPDLMASIAVAKKGRGDMAIANAVGSNIFDILFALGVPWIISIAIKNQNVQVGTESLLSSVFLLFATVVAILFILIVKKWEIGKRAGILLVALYIMYVIYNVYWAIS